jgi:magnesium-dependent phosphatase 1
LPFFISNQYTFIFYYYLQDATLWIPEMYELYGPPFKLDKKDPNYLVDGSGERISLMGASRQILKELATDEKWRETTVAYVSRTEHPKWAASCLNLFSITEGISMNDIGLEQEIYPGSKTRHFRRIQERTSIEYSEMLFFDNESWNITDVAPMGVVSVHTPRGMTTEVWKQGLEAFGAAAEARERGETPKLAIRGSRKGGFDW